MCLVKSEYSKIINNLNETQVKEVDNNIKEASTIWLELTIRDKKYIYNLKGSE